MWKPIKRLWSREQSAEKDDNVDETPLEEKAPTPAPKVIDPLSEELEAYDALRSPEGKAQALRTLLLRHPLESRVLDRASSLMQEMAGEDEGMRTLGLLFSVAARSSELNPLLELSDAFLQLSDIEMALAFAEGALLRGRPKNQEKPGLLQAALVLSHGGRHEEVVRRLDKWLRSEKNVSPSSQDANLNLGLRVRYAVSLVVLESMGKKTGGRLQHVLPYLDSAEPWISSAMKRAESLPWRGSLPKPLSEIQHLYFVLYGTALLEGQPKEAIEVTHIARWMKSLSGMLKSHFPEGIRPAWISPEGEVLARCLGRISGENSAIPMSARLPKQAILFMAASDDDLEQLYALGPEEGVIVFQAFKNPMAFGSPMPDILGCLGEELELPFAPLYSEMARDRLTPRMLASELMDSVPIGTDVANSLSKWLEKRVPFMAYQDSMRAEDHFYLDSAGLREEADKASEPSQTKEPDSGE